MRHMNKASEIDVDSEGGLSLRMLDYIQSIIVSVRPSEQIQNEITDKQWQELRSLVRDLFNQVTVDFQMCLTAVNRRNAGYNPDFEEFYFEAQLYWVNVRGKRYLNNEIPYYRDVLSPHNDVLKELFDVSTDELLHALQEIQASLTFGIGKTAEDLREFQHLSISKLEEKMQTQDIDKLGDVRDLMTKVIEENGWGDWKDDILGRFIGLDLFDLKKITELPNTLLDELSYEHGQDTEFFAEGKYKGWPLRVWPVFKRPFIKLDGHYYCFDLNSLFDNLYRSVERVIIRKKPGFRELWNHKQKELSEQIPIKLFRRLLPEAKVYHPVYYRWDTGLSSGKQWCEADALLTYEDHLFIVESKGGAFTHTSPATDFPAYIDSLKNLLLKPAEQGKRFLEYLESKNEVALYDSNHIEIGRLSRKDFEHITICAVSLDPFTEMASQLQHLKRIGIDVGIHPVWPISIDDLRVYSDIFDSPLVFLHFVAQRMRAFHSDLIKTEDELDHLGLYLKHNIYADYAQKLDSENPIRWIGYREDIDKYYYEKLHNPDAACSLKQEMPPRLNEVINFLSKSNKAGRRKISSVLLNLSGEWRNSIFSGIDDILRQQAISCRAKSLSHGEITLFCWQEGVIERNKRLALEHSQATMLVTQDKERVLLELTFDADGAIVDVDFSFLRLQDIPANSIEELKTVAETLRRKRLNEAKHTFGKIGRNDRCPCGSSKKYKKCCGA